MDIKLTLLSRVKGVGQKEKCHCIVAAYYFIYLQMNGIVPELEYFIIICHSTERLIERIGKRGLCIFFFLDERTCTYITDCDAGPTHFVHIQTLRNKSMVFHKFLFDESWWNRLASYNSNQTQHLVILETEYINISSNW